MSLFTDVIDGADIWMIQSKGCARFKCEADKNLLIVYEPIGQELKSDEWIQADIFGLVHHSLPPPPSFSTMR